MKSEGTTLLVSLLMHLALVAGAASLAPFSPKQPVPILVDFTMEQGQHEQKRVMADDHDAVPSRSVPLRPSTKESVPIVAASPEPFSAPAHPVEETAPSSPARMAVPVAAAATSSGSALGPPVKAVQGTQGTKQLSGDNASRSASGSGGDNMESQQRRYLKEHFAHIRDTIAENLRYPAKARKMGWHGRLAVEFVVLASGAVDQIRITKSSGIALLDSDAEETVRRSAPFPKPPVSARLIIPVDYVLN